MHAPIETTSSRIPQWVRAALVGCFVLAATAVGLFAYQQFNKPKTITIAAGSPDGGLVKMMTAIAGQLPKSSSIRLNIVALGSTFEAAKAFSTGRG